MDWLFRPIGRFFVWSFNLISSLNWTFDLFLVFTTLILIAFWFYKIYAARNDGKGLYKKP